MKSKLTLSLPEKTILQAKQIAIHRRTTVSALFAESLKQWQFEPGPPFKPENHDYPDDVRELIGIFSSQAPYDARSARIREKHG